MTEKKGVRVHVTSNGGVYVDQRTDAQRRRQEGHRASQKNFPNHERQEPRVDTGRKRQGNLIPKFDLPRGLP